MDIELAKHKSKNQGAQYFQATNILKSRGYIYMFVCMCITFWYCTDVPGRTLNNSQGRILRNVGRENMEHNFGLLQIILVSLMSCVSQKLLYYRPTLRISGFHYLLLGDNFPWVFCISAYCVSKHRLPLFWITFTRMCIQWTGLEDYSVSLQS